MAPTLHLFTDIITKPISWPVETFSERIILSAFITFVSFKYLHTFQSLHFGTSSALLMQSLCLLMFSGFLTSQMNSTNIVSFLFFVIFTVSMTCASNRAT